MTSPISLPYRPELPSEFDDLSGFVPQWVLPSEEERFRKLHSVSLEELRAFYDVMLPRLPAIMDYLGQFKLHDLPVPARTLFDLALTFVETSHPIDLGWGDTDFPGAYRWQAFEFRSISQRSRADPHPAARSAA